MILQIDELEGDGTSGSSAVTVVAGDSARLPTAPSSPNTRLNVALGALIGLALGIGYAVIRHVLDRRLRDPRDIERETGVAVVGTIPLDKDLAASRRVLVFDEVLGDSGSVIVAEALRELRTNLQFMSVDNPPRSIVVTSPVPGDGKSTTAANLAVSLAAAGEPVILIDADLRRPVISSLFGLPDGAGLTDVIAGRATVDDVSHRIDDTLMVIGAGRIPPNPSELLGSQRMRDLVKQLSASALVIIDTPAAAAGDRCRDHRHPRRRCTHRHLGRPHHLRHAAEGARESRTRQRTSARRRAQQGAAAQRRRGILRLPVPVVSGERRRQGREEQGDEGRQGRRHRARSAQVGAPGRAHRRVTTGSVELARVVALGAATHP